MIGRGWQYNSSKSRTEIFKKLGLANNKIIDQYTGEIFNQAFMDIDHLIPLKAVHSAGGCRWSSAKKKAYANNTDNLFATHRSYNRSKGSKTINEWLPLGGRDQRINNSYTKKYAKIVSKYKLDPASVNLMRVVVKSKDATVDALAYASSYKKTIKVGKVVAIGTVAVSAGVIAAGGIVIYEVLIIAEDPQGYWDDYVSIWETTSGKTVEWSLATFDWTIEQYNGATGWVTDKIKGE